MREFAARMQSARSIALYVVELAYGDQPFEVTDASNPAHLQLRGTDVMWHKENMINLGTRLLPADWKAMAWIDADIEFENVFWAEQALCILNGYKDVVQLFSHCLDMDIHENTMAVYNSAGYQYETHGHINGKNADYPHPGYAWAITRQAYETMGGLFEVNIIGSSDTVMLQAIMGTAERLVSPKAHPEYLQTIRDLQMKCSGLKFGYVPGVIRHYFHGSKKNRKYAERAQILLDYNYSPKDVARNDDGVLCFQQVNPAFQKAMLQYFFDRNEDDGDTQEVKAVEKVPKKKSKTALKSFFVPERGVTTAFQFALRFR